MEEASCCKTETDKEDGKSNVAAAADDDDKPFSVQGSLRRLSGPTRRSSKANWTEEEDDILRDAVKKYEGKSWKKIAGCLSGRTDVQCLHRWQKVLNPELVKGPWSKEEDGILVELVGRFGEKKWSEIAEQLPGRMGKQCRERWYNHLKPEINKAAWTDEEERILINAHAEYGNKWSILAKLLPGRTENSVKNHWNCSLKKKLCNYSASGSAVNRPRLTVPPLQANNKGVTQDSTEANQTLVTSSLSYPPFSGKSDNPERPQKLVEAEENPSTICSWKESVDRGSNRESSASGIARSSLRPSPSTSCNIDMSKTLNHGTTKTQVQGFTSLDDNDQRHKPSHGCSAPPETSPRSSNRDVCGDLESSSEWSYTGLWYEPIQREDLNIFLCTGRFPSSERYIREPKPVCVPPSRRHMKEPCDSYSSTRSILRSAAMNYRNMPSIIRKRAFQLLHKGVSAPDNGVGPLNRGAAGDEVTKVDDDQVHTCVFLSQMSESLKSLQPLNLWGFERESWDA